MSAKQCEKVEVGSTIIYYVKSEPIAYYRSDDNIIVSAHGRCLSGWGNLLDIVENTIKLGGEAILVPNLQFEAEIEKLTGIVTRPAPKPKPEVEDDDFIDDREPLILEIIEEETFRTETGITVGAVRSILEERGIQCKGERWVHDLIYRLYKAGKLRGTKIGSKMHYEPTDR